MPIPSKTDSRTSSRSNRGHGSLSHCGALVVATSRRVGGRFGSSPLETSRRDSGIPRFGIDEATIGGPEECSLGRFLVGSVEAGVAVRCGASEAFVWVGTPLCAGVGGRVMASDVNVGGSGSALPSLRGGGP